MNARVLIADDHTILLEAFKALLEPEFDVVGTVTDGRALLTEFSRLNPDVVLIDISMPLLTRLAPERPPFRVFEVRVAADEVGSRPADIGRSRRATDAVAS